MLTLTYRRRKLLASSGAMFVCAGFALIPVFGHSAPGGELASANAVVAPIPDSPNRPRSVRAHADPFARALPAMGETRVQRSRKLTKKNRDVRIVAIVVGAQAHALLSLESGTTQIVGIGDTIEGLRVVSITSNMVVLSDGRRLQFSDRSQ